MAPEERAIEHGDTRPHAGAASPAVGGKAAGHRGRMGSRRKTRRQCRPYAPGLFTCPHWVAGGRSSPVSGGPPSRPSRSRAAPTAALSRTSIAPASVQGQAGEDLDPRGDPVRVVRQSGGPAEDPADGPVVREESPAVGAQASRLERGSDVQDAGPRGTPVAASQSRAVRSSLPVRTVRPSGLNGTAPDQAVMPQGRADGAGRSPRPRAAPSVVAPGERASCRRG